MRRAAPTLCAHGRARRDRQRRPSRVARPSTSCSTDEQFTELSGERIDTRHTHGTGCTFASAIAARLAQGDDLLDAARAAKAFVTRALRQAPGLGHGRGPLGHCRAGRHLTSGFCLRLLYSCPCPCLASPSCRRRCRSRRSAPPSSPMRGHGGRRLRRGGVISRRRARDPSGAARASTSTTRRSSRWR